MVLFGFNLVYVCDVGQGELVARKSRQCRYSYQVSRDWDDPPRIVTTRIIYYIFRCEDPEILYKPSFTMSQYGCYLKSVPAPKNGHN